MSNTKVGKQGVNKNGKKNTGDIVKDTAADIVFNAEQKFQINTGQTPIERIEALIECFEKMQDRFKHFGASDTEPDGVFQVILVRAFKGKNPKIPTTADEWELFTRMKGADVAAQRLGAVASLVATAIGECPISQSAKLRKFLEDYCWRVSW